MIVGGWENARHDWIVDSRAQESNKHTAHTPKNI